MSSTAVAESSGPARWIATTVEFLKSVRGELGKVTWPTRPELVNATRMIVVLSVLLGLIMLTKAWGYYLGQFDLLTSTRGVVVGASYTDVNAQLPALRILVVIAIACAILFLVNKLQRRLARGQAD